MHFSFPDGNAVRINCHDSDSLLAEVRQRLTDGRGFAIATINVDHLQRLAHDRIHDGRGVSVNVGAPVDEQRALRLVAMADSLAATPQHAAAIKAMIG